MLLTMSRPDCLQFNLRYDHLRFRQSIDPLETQRYPGSFGYLCPYLSCTILSLLISATKAASTFPAVADNEEWCHVSNLSIQLCENSLHFKVPATPSTITKLRTMRRRGIGILKIALGPSPGQLVLNPRYAIRWSRRPYARKNRTQMRNGATT